MKVRLLTAALLLTFSVLGYAASIYDTSGSYSTAPGVCSTNFCEGKVASIYNTSGSYSYVEVDADTSTLNCNPVGGKYLRYNNNDPGANALLGIVLSAKTLNSNIAVYLKPTISACQIESLILE